MILAGINRMGTRLPYNLTALLKNCTPRSNIISTRNAYNNNHMSLVPFIVNEILDELDRPSLYDQHFGLPLSILPNPRDRYRGLLPAPLRSGYLRPWRHLDHDHSGVSTVTCDKDGFKVNLDVQQFKPDELSVKVVDDFVVIEGKHEERSDEHGFISRQFTRRYKLPKEVNAQALSSSLSSDGVLQLHAPKLAIEKAGERSIPITHTRQPAVKQNGEPPKKSANQEKMES